MPSSPPLDLCQDGEVCKSGADLIEVDVQAWLYGPLLFFFFFFFFFFFPFPGLCLMLIHCCEKRMNMRDIGFVDK